jgi:RNA polymerase sigma-70 factor (ECF subfamily)
MALWKGADRWRGDGEVAAWLWGIAARRLVSRLLGFDFGTADQPAQELVTL